MKIYKHILLGFFSAIALSGAAEETVIYDLRVQDNFDPSTQFSPGHDRDDYVWKWARYTISATNDASGPEMYNNREVNEPYYADIFMTRDIELEAGVNYSVAMRPRCYSSTGTGKLTVLLGQGTITEGTYDRGELRELGKYENIPYVSTYNMSSFDAIEQLRCDFSVAVSGKYKVCFFGQGYGLTLHDTYIVKTDAQGDGEDEPDVPTPDPVVPEKVTELTAEVTGDYEVTLGFMLPVLSTAGASLEGSELKYTVYRDGEQATAKSRQQPGTYVSYTDSEVEAGEHEYGVEVSLGDAKSDKATVKVTVTEPTPAVPPMETVDLPFSDSFAGASFGNKWQVEEVSGAVTWIASGALTSQLPLMQEFDGDGGMAVFKGWDGSNGDFARLVTAPITKASSTAPVLDFMFGHSGARATTDKVKVQVSADDGPWQDVEGAVIATYIPEIEDGGWTYYKYSIDPYIADCTTYRVGFLGICENLNANIPIDAVNIYNVSDKDVALTGFTAPEEVFAGNDIEFSVVLDNKGAATLKASDYTVSVESDFPGEVVFENADVPSLATVTVTGKVTVTAEEVLDGPEYTFKAKVSVPGNATEEELVSEAVKVTTGFVDCREPANLTAAEGENGSVTFQWESVKDLEHKNISITENFNDLQERTQVEQPTPDGKTEKVWVDGTKGNFNGFVSVDLDKQDGGSYYSASGSEFQVFKDFMTGSLPQGHTGKYIALTLPGNIQQDDWLITPALEASETSVINFGARIAYIHRESDSYNNSLEVLYTTEEYNKNNPAASFKKSLLSNTSKATTGTLPHDGLYHWLRVNGIPAEAKYVAIHFNTKSGMQTGVWIDQLSVTETDLHPLTGYYVYRRDFGRLNETPLAPAELSYVLTEASEFADDQFYVTALYGDGESQPSNYVGTKSSAVSVETTDVNIVAVSGGVLIQGFSKEAAQVFTLDGKAVTSVKCTGLTTISLEKGLYLVKVGAKVAKVLVK